MKTKIKWLLIMLNGIALLLLVTGCTRADGITQNKRLVVFPNGWQMLCGEIRTFRDEAQFKDCMPSAPRERFNSGDIVCSQKACWERN